MSRSTPPDPPETAPASGGLSRHEVMTLVFTDLVGSTRLKEELGNPGALRLIHGHHALVRELLREYPEGFEVSTAGDSFFIAFRRPSDAVAFALRLQVRLRTWNAGRTHPLQDRIGIHAGEVTVETDASGGMHDLHGLEVDKGARVMSLAGPNQILLTRFAYDNARAALRGQELPEVGEIRWANHGPYRLKGVVEPVEITAVADTGAGEERLGAPEDSDKAQRVTGGDGGRSAAPAHGWRRWLRDQPPPGREAWVGGALVAVAGLMALVVPWFATASYDLAYLARPPERPSEAVIVAMDRESHDALKQSGEDRWDRRLHAALIDRMNDYGARAVVFDVLFDQPVPESPEADRALVEAARRFGRVAMAGVVQGQRRGDLELVQDQGPFAELAAVARWGIVPKGGVAQQVRRVHPGSAGRDSLASEVAQLLGRERRPEWRTAWLNYYGPPGTIPSVPYAHVISNFAGGLQFSNQLVFVGAVRDLGYSQGWVSDDFPTPYTPWTGRWTPGVEIVATACLNLWRGDWLRRTPGWVEALVVVALGIAAVQGLIRCRPLPGLVAALGVGLVWMIGAMVLVWTTRLWFPWLVFGLGQLPLALAWSVLVSPAVASRR